MRLLLIALLACVTTAFAAVSQSASGADEADPDSKSWVELEVGLPPYPKPASLVEFRVGAVGGNRFLIDADTLSIGADGVVRYALVVRSAGGAENVSFEGIRCQTREQKFYAFGQRNGTWARARDARWRAIEFQGANRQHGVLYRDFMCAEDARPLRSAREIMQKIRYGNSRRPVD